MNSDQYKTIKSKSEGFFKDRSSKFYALAFPVKTDEEIRIIRESVRKEYHDARHHVYAYRLGSDMKIFRASDDGEPSNSSGPPVLGKIKSYELTDILIIVVRYFGGTKLGIPGLINAYGSAAEDAINNAKIIIKTITKELTVKFEYPQMNDVMRIIKDNNLNIKEQDFQLSCKIVLEIPENDFVRVYNSFKNNHKLDIAY
ncbi:MAG: IMPACT family protein [Bacteroidales bacterium]|nr:IMPACT family protein [Bacteroidales bacterium]